MKSPLFSLTVASGLLFGALACTVPETDFAGKRCGPSDGECPAPLRCSRAADGVDRCALPGAGGPPEFAVGTFQSLDASSSGSTQSISLSLSTPPRAVLLFAANLSGNSRTAAAQLSVGAVVANDARAVSFADSDNVSPVRSVRRRSASALSVIDATGNLLGEASLSAMSASALSVSWSQRPTTAFDVHYLVIAGADVDAQLVDFTLPSSGSSATLPGLTFKPDALIALHTGAGSLPLGSNAPGSYFGFGAWASDSSQWAVARGRADAQTGPDPLCFFANQRAFTVISPSTGNLPPPLSRFGVTSVEGSAISGPLAGAASGVSGSFLALRGIRASAGVAQLASGASAVSVAGLSFPPRALLLAGTQSANVDAFYDAVVTLGVATSSTAASVAARAQTGTLSASRAQMAGSSYVLLLRNDSVPASGGLPTFTPDGFSIALTAAAPVAVDIDFVALGPP